MDGVLKLYFGESNLPTPEFIKRAAQKAMADGFTFYTENAGLPSLRKALARYYQELHARGIGCRERDRGHRVRRAGAASRHSLRARSGRRSAGADARVAQRRGERRDGECSAG